MTITFELICGVCLGIDWVHEEEVIMIDLFIIRMLILY